MGKMFFWIVGCSGGKVVVVRTYGKEKVIEPGQGLLAFVPKICFSCREFLVVNKMGGGSYD
jgi:hypothetical protein